MPLEADTVYSKSAPWQSNEERLVSAALVAVTGVPGQWIALNTRPPVPRIQLFPPRFGYRSEAFGIDDVVKVNEVYPGARVDYSGSVSGYSGTSFPSLPVM